MNRILVLQGRRAILLTLLWTFAGSASSQTATPTDLSDASLEQLMNVDVTSASKKEQKLSKVAASIYVLNQDDIRRSGATSIPDLLRLVPGMDVAQVSQDTWAVSVRGFNNIWADKLLVLIDGRSVYNPALSGTLWDTQDVPLADIDRIEIIRGPGATLWGANAVNGVINIITKNSRDTAGGLIQAAAGSQLAEQGLAQFGGAVGKDFNYRLFGNSTLNLADGKNVLGLPGADAGGIMHFGLRADWKLGDHDALLLEGDISTSEVDHTYDGFYSYRPPYVGQFADEGSSHVASVLGKWTRTYSPSSDLSVQLYYDEFHYALYGLHQRISTVDLDVEDRFSVGSRNDIVVGMDARDQPGTIAAGYSVYFGDPDHTNWLVGGFAQDEIKVSDSVWVTAGTKFEYNEHTAANLQPSLRLLWAPSKRNSIWAAVSKARREPSREDEDVRVASDVIPLPNGLNAIVTGSGNPDIQAEELIAYEAGYRFEPNKYLSLDLSTFYNHYTKLISIDPSGSPFLSFDPQPVHVVIPLEFTNGVKANTFGGEVSGVIKVTRQWKLTPGYALMRTRLPGTLTDSSFYNVQGDAPENQVQLRSAIDLRPNLQFDSFLMHASPLVHQSVPSYTRLDLRLGWRISDSFDLSIVGQNLLERHSEFGLGGSTLALPVYLGRSAYLRCTYRF